MAEPELQTIMKKYDLPQKGKIQLVTVPRIKFLMIDGKGAPEGGEFHEAIQAMYGLAFTLKFKSKKERGIDYRVMPLEGLWWTKGGGFDPKARDKWLWTLMIAVPESMTTRAFKEGAEELRKRKNPARLGDIRLEEFEEGLSVQAMHVGPYSTESETIAKMEAFATEHGYEMNGKHHEVYLGDPRRAAPSKLRTVVRHPVVKWKGRV